jgi:hypothetical protein
MKEFQNEGSENVSVKSLKPGKHIDIMGDANGYRSTDSE